MSTINAFGFKSASFSYKHIVTATDVADAAVTIKFDSPRDLVFVVNVLRGGEALSGYLVTSTKDSVTVSSNGSTFELTEGDEIIVVGQLDGSKLIK